MDTFFRDNEVHMDSLTDAYTFDTINTYASHLINQKIEFSYLFLDLDNFTYLQDAFGKAVANKVLFDVAKEIKSIIREKGVLARNQDDEFSIVLKNITDYDSLWDYCHTILVRINELQIEEIGYQTLTLTIGIARFPENASNVDDLLLCVKKSLYRGKTKGRNCFIIYLPEKHANIEPKDDKQKALGSMSLHSNVYRFLTSTDDLRIGIISLFNFFSSYFEIDHICIQSDSRIIIQKINSLSQTKSFEHIPHQLIRANMNRLTEVLYVNDTKNLLKGKHEELYNCLTEQNIKSTCLCDISYRNSQYGILRADMTVSDTENHLWKYSEMDLLLTAAKTIALILHYTGKNLETL